MSPSCKYDFVMATEIRTESKMSDKDDEKAKSRPISGEGEEDKQPSTPSLKAATHKLKQEALRRLQLPDAEDEGTSDNVEGSHGMEGGSITDERDLAQPIGGEEASNLASASLNKSRSNVSELSKDGEGGSGSNLELTQEGSNSDALETAKNEKEGRPSSTGGQGSGLDNENRKTGEPSSKEEVGKTDSGKDTQDTSQISNDSRPGSGKGRLASSGIGKSSSRPGSSDEAKKKTSRPASGKNQEDAAGGSKVEVSGNLGGEDNSQDMSAGESRISGGGSEAVGRGGVTSDLSGGESGKSNIREGSNSGEDGKGGGGIGPSTVESKNIALDETSNVAKDGKKEGKDIVLDASTGEISRSVKDDSSAGKAGSKEEGRGTAEDSLAEESGSDKAKPGIHKEGDQRVTGVSGQTDSQTMSEAQTGKADEGIDGEGHKSSEKTVTGQGSGNIDEPKHSNEKAEANNKEELSDEISPPVGNQGTGKEGASSNKEQSTDDVSNSKQEVGETKDSREGEGKTQTDGDIAQEVTRESDQQKSSDVDAGKKVKKEGEEI